MRKTLSDGAPLAANVWAFAACAARDVLTLERRSRRQLSSSAPILAWKCQDGDVSQHAAAQASKRRPPPAPLKARMDHRRCTDRQGTFTGRP